MKIIQKVKQKTSEIWQSAPSNGESDLEHIKSLVALLFSMFIMPFWGILFKNQVLILKFNPEITNIIFEIIYFSASFYLSFKGIKCFIRLINSKHYMLCFAVFPSIFVLLFYTIMSVFNGVVILDNLLTIRLININSEKILPIIRGVNKWVYGYNLLFITFFIWSLLLNSVLPVKYQRLDIPTKKKLYRIAIKIILIAFSFLTITGFLIIDRDSWTIAATLSILIYSIVDEKALYLLTTKEFFIDDLLFEIKQKIVLAKIFVGEFFFAWIISVNFIKNREIKICIFMGIFLLLAFGTLFITNNFQNKHQETFRSWFVSDKDKIK